MFSLLAIVATVLVLVSALLWRAVRTLSRPTSRARAVSRPRSGGGASLIERTATKRGRLQTARSASAPVASAGLPRRW